MEYLALLEKFQIGREFETIQIRYETIHRKIYLIHIT